MPLGDIATIVITTQVGGVSQQGFGVPLVLGYNAGWVERTRTYNDILGVGADFATTTPEYKAADAIFSQIPCPPQIMIARGALPPTMQFIVKVAAVANLRTYSFKWNGTTYSYISDGTATNDEIVAGLIAAAGAAITAGGFTATALGASGSQTVKILANAAGNWGSVEILDPSILLAYQVHADPGIATDLTAIALENNDWYHLVTLFNSQLCILASSAWVEPNFKLYTPDSGDSEIITVAVGVPATDVAFALFNLSYARTGLIYHPSNAAFAGAALPGVCLPNAPGSETWMFKTLAGVPSVQLTPTHIANLKAKRANYYYTIAGRAITANGQVASPVSAFFDIVRLRDWLQVRMQERLFIVLANATKVPYTDPGVALLEAQVRAQLEEGVLVGGVNADYTVITGKVALENPADRAARIYKGIRFAATLQGAIHHLNINGVLSLA